MTMKVTVTNNDEHRTALVSVLEASTNPAGSQKLGPGESAEFWIHSARALMVEVQPEPKPEKDYPT